MDKVLEKWNSVLQGLHKKLGTLRFTCHPEFRRLGMGGLWSKQTVGLDKSASSGFPKKPSLNKVESR